MSETLPNTAVSTDATLFREEAERARRDAAAMTDKKSLNRLNEIAALGGTGPSARQRAFKGRVRTRLAAGGRWIRTLGPAQDGNVFPD
jgi:hypothetical protein